MILTSQISAGRNLREFVANYRHPAPRRGEPWVASARPDFVSAGKTWQGVDRLDRCDRHDRPVRGRGRLRRSRPMEGEKRAEAVTGTMVHLRLRDDNPRRDGCHRVDGPRSRWGPNSLVDHLRLIPGYRRLRRRWHRGHHRQRESSESRAYHLHRILARIQP